jgi:hypothetical protein
MIESCKCDDCSGSEFPCHGDCAIDAQCQGCRDNAEETKDREFDEKVALGYL